MGTRKRVQIVFNDPSLTKQCFAADADINNIMRKFEQTGMIDHLSKYEGSYQDLTDMPDYHTALNAVISAQEMFMSLPAEVRANFKNDPGEFLEFVDKPENIDKLREWGLASELDPKPVLKPLSSIKEEGVVSNVAQDS